MSTADVQEHVVLLTSRRFRCGEAYFGTKVWHLHSLAIPTTALRIHEVWQAKGWDMRKFAASSGAPIAKQCAFVVSYTVYFNLLLEMSQTYKIYSQNVALLNARCGENGSRRKRWWGFWGDQVLFWLQGFDNVCRRRSLSNETLDQQAPLKDAGSSKKGNMTSTLRY
ncbi:Interferon-induced 6-16 [Macrophomina phaseolina MS6]|uniref:Interferon-induced 6-16 n=1 Tax=Macrophomina phaseolina (strain MS6) TaxID=1126212 RepID=K2RIB5_MACPH|nr:Interferon-induced 6-16 [Macrophomina phaseolina MS6]